MKITVFNGSPRGRDSNSHKIVEPLLAGAREAGAETEEIYLIEKDIKYCRGCFSCWGNTPGCCIIKDDMLELIDLFLASDYVGMATPVYGMYMTALLKNFYDRLLPLATPQIHKNDDGSFYHKGRATRFPRQFFVINSGFPGEHNFDILKAFVGMVNPVLAIYRNCGEILSEQGIADSPINKKIEDFRTALHKAGKEMVTNGEVSKETVEQIHLELISDEEYMAGVNKDWDDKIK
ncbi:MAG: flavodoxin family protein [Candidatus Cloacimonetes bacterium]|nr:flavodoxin family protein [Candidatus Cloacimonadota bacterium]